MARTIIKGVNKVELDCKIIGKKKPNLQQYGTYPCFIKVFVEHSITIGQRTQRAFFSVKLSQHVLMIRRYRDCHLYHFSRFRVRLAAWGAG